MKVATRPFQRIWRLTTPLSCSHYECLSYNNRKYQFVNQTNSWLRKSLPMKFGRTQGLRQLFRVRLFIYICSWRLRRRHDCINQVVAFIDKFTLAASRRYHRRPCCTHSPRLEMVKKTLQDKMKTLTTRRPNSQLFNSAEFDSESTDMWIN